MRRQAPRVRLVLAALACAAGAAAHEPERAERLDEILVEGDQPQSAASADDISAKTFELRPHATLQEILNNVPGLIVRQHQGGGKAPQYLIRGFNADHGTDFLVTVDGLPVNLVTHGHGQGYADPNFVIPETIETLRLRKGPYFPELGDLAVAGALDMVTKERFAEDFVLGEFGSYDRYRAVFGASPKLGNVQTLFAGQGYWSNGPFLNEENFARYNAYSRFTVQPMDDAELWGAATFYAADWDASGQIPLRLVSAGQLDRFGAIDPTEGGRTDRENLDLHWDQELAPGEHVAAQLWASRYKLRLWSNFTFFQDDPVRGDGIEQNDSRFLWGANAHWTKGWTLGPLPLATTFGYQMRGDDIQVALHHQQRRQRFATVSDTHVLEQSFGGYWNQQFFFTDWLRFEGGVRVDYFTFDVASRDDVEVPIDGFDDAAIVSPKASLIVNPEPPTDVYLNFGSGFHSNDARGVIQADQRDDPNFEALPRAVGGEVGARTRRWERLDLAAAFWVLDLQQEVVFCGDCGTIEQESDITGSSFAVTPATRRWGIDFETRLRLTDWLTLDYDLSYADPRYQDTGEAIPIAPTLFMNGGLTAELPYGFSAAFRVRYLDDRPAIEDRSLPARGYLIFDLFAKYRWRNVELGLDLLNLGDEDWAEAVFADSSCTRAEVRAGRCGARPNVPFTPGGPDIHFTPGDPFQARGRVTVFF